MRLYRLTSLLAYCAFVGVVLAGPVAKGQSAMDDSLPKIVPSAANTELQRFALWFHQDWKLVFATFDAGASMYFNMLSEKSRKDLIIELRQFIAETQALDTDDALQAWWSLGAQAWPKNVNLVEKLREYLGILERQ